MTDGNYVGRTYDLRLPRADTVVFLDQPRWLCLVRAFRRWLLAFGRTRPEMAEAGKYPTPVTVLSGDRAADRFLEEIDQRKAASSGPAS